MTASDRSSMNIPDELEAPKPELKALKILNVRDYIFPAPRPPLIDGCVQRGTQMTLFGQPGAAKSAIAMSWAVHIAAGVPWLGHDVDQGRVLYVAAEGIEDEVMKRFAGFTSNIGADLDVMASNLVIQFQPEWKLEDPTKVERFLQACEAQELGLFDLIVLDTYSCLSKVDTNSSQETMIANDGIKRIQHAPQFREHEKKRPPTVLTIMHEAKAAATSSKATAMGSNSQMGNVDVAMRMTSEDDDSYVLHRDVKNRDGRKLSALHLVMAQTKFIHSAFVDDIVDDTYEAVHSTFAIKLKDTQMPGKIRDSFNWYLTQWENNGDERPANKQLVNQAKIDGEQGWSSGNASKTLDRFRQFNLVDDDDAPLVERLPESDSVDQQVLDLWGTSVVGEGDE